MYLSVFIKVKMMSTKLYEVVLQGTLFNQLIINRWNYRSDGDDVPSTNSFGLVSAMGLIPTSGTFPASTIGDAMQALASTSMTWQQVIARAVYDPLDFVDIPYVPNAAGEEASAASESPLIAYGFRTNRVRTDIGRGYKRFAGVTEDAVDAGGVIASAVTSSLSALAGFMSDVLSFTESALTINFTPCVVKKQKYTTGSGHVAYRYIPVADGGETAQLADTATGITWSPYTQVRSQVSRQYGKGR